MLGSLACRETRRFLIVRSLTSAGVPGDAAADDDDDLNEFLPNAVPR